jgi:hypothetical protein
LLPRAAGRPVLIPRAGMTLSLVKTVFVCFVKHGGYAMKKSLPKPFAV